MISIIVIGQVCGGVGTLWDFGLTCDNSSSRIYNDLIQDDVPQLVNTELESSLKSNFRVFPNPATNKVYIAKENHEGKYNAKLIDATGRQVFKADKIMNDNYEMDVSQLTSGVYILHLELDDRNIVKKLIIE